MASTMLILRSFCVAVLALTLASVADASSSSLSKKATTTTVKKRRHALSRFRAIKASAKGGVLRMSTDAHLRATAMTPDEMAQMKMWNLDKSPYFDTTKSSVVDGLHLVSVPAGQLMHYGGHFGCPEESLCPLGLDGLPVGPVTCPDEDPVPVDMNDLEHLKPQCFWPGQKRNQPGWMGGTSVANAYSNKPGQYVYTYQAKRDLNMLDALNTGSIDTIISSEHVKGKCPTSLGFTQAQIERSMKGADKVIEQLTGDEKKTDELALFKDIVEESTITGGKKRRAWNSTKIITKFIRAAFNHNEGRMQHWFSSDKAITQRTSFLGVDIIALRAICAASQAAGWNLDGYIAPPLKLSTSKFPSEVGLCDPRSVTNLILKSDPTTGFVPRVSTMEPFISGY